MEHFRQAALPNTKLHHLLSHKTSLRLNRALLHGTDFLLFLNMNFLVSFNRVRCGIQSDCKIVFIILSNIGLTIVREDEHIIDNFGTVAI